MILYHGTNVAFDSIDLSKSKPNKDFGQQHMKGITFQYFFGTEAAIKLLKRL